MSANGLNGGLEPLFLETIPGQASQLTRADGTRLGSPVTATSTSDGGVKYPFTRNPGGGQYTFEELLPKNMPVINPANYSGTIASSGGLTTAVDTSKSSRGLGQSLKLSTAGAVTNAQHRIPIAADMFGAQPKIGSRLCIEIECDDWTKVTRLYFQMAVGANLLNYHAFAPIEGGVSSFGMTDPATAAAWNGKVRVITFQSDRIGGTVGTPPAWGLGGASTRYFSPTGMGVQLSTTGAVNINIHYVYSPEWPVGFVSIIGDGAYTTFQEKVIRPMAARGKRGGVSMGRPREINGVAFYPSKAELKWISDMGWDVFPHIHNVNTVLPVYLSTANSVAPGNPATDQNTFNYMLQSLHALKTMLSDIGVNAQGLRWGQFLQNNGNLLTADTARALRAMGIDACRVSCPDPEFGYNPFNTAYTNAFTIGVEKTGGWMCGWESPFGRYNRMTTDWFAGTTTPAGRDTYGGSVTQKIIEFCANNAEGCNTYTHRILPGGGVNPANQYDSGEKFTEDLLADIFAKEAAGNLLILSPTEVEMLTYWRDGDVFLNSFNQWVYRHDPTKIAF